MARQQQQQSLTNADFVGAVLSGDDIYKHMTDCIDEVNEVMKIPATKTRILMSHFRWDKQVLLERFYDSDPETFFLDTHIISPFVDEDPDADTHDTGAVTESTHSTSETETETESTSLAGVEVEIECDICCLTIPEDNLTGLECGHKFCQGCWSQYLTAKIMEEGMGHMIFCAQHRCNILVDDVTVMNLVRDPAVKLKYQHLITNTFVECNKLLRWCPEVNCGRAIKVVSYECQPVTCSCGHVFCFACGQNSHEPVKCEWFKRWLLLNENNLGEPINMTSSAWIAANTKECPKCKALIQKQGGCDHMVCKKCLTEFCWICLRLKRHSEHCCQTPILVHIHNNAEPLKLKRHLAQRYAFHKERYIHHTQRLDLEKTLRTRVEKATEGLRKTTCTESPCKLNMLRKAVDVLLQSHHYLANLYIYTFFLQENNHSVLLGYTRDELERATTSLDESLMTDISLYKLAEIERKYNYCEERRRIAVDQVDEDEDFFEYNTV